MKDKICESCGQRIREMRKESLTKMKLKMLRAAADHVIATGKNDFMTRDFTSDEEYKLYSNFQHLRYHGLIAHVKVNGKKVRKHWLITRNGWAFLRGDIQLPKYIMVRNDSTQSRSDRLVSLGDVWYGADYIQTTFEYFDHETGKPIGWRPTNPKAAENIAQATLL